MEWLAETELNSFIQNLSGTQPPEWVSETLISISGQRPEWSN